MRIMSPGARREFSELERKLESVSTSLVAVRDELASRETRLKSAEQLQQALGQQLAQALADAETEAAAKEALIQERNELVGKVNELTGARNELTGQVNELTGARNDLIGQVNALSGEHGRLSAALSEVTTARNALVGDVSRLTAETSRLSGAVNELTAERNTLVGQANVLTQRINELSGAQNILTEERNALVGKANAQTQRVNELSGALNALTEERNALVGEVNRLTKENNGLAGLVNDLTGERNRLVAEVSVLTSERNALVGKNSELTGERNRLVGQVSSLTGERNKLVAQVSALTGERNSAVGLINELSQAKGELAASVDSLKHNLGHLSRQAQGLQTAPRRGLRELSSSIEPRARPRFLIVSNMRSGSTWVETLLGALPDVATDLELKWALRFEPGPVHVDLATTESSLSEILDSVSATANIVGSKLVLDPVDFGPVDFDLLGARIEPDIKIVHLVRSYRDILLSIRRGAMHQPSARSNARIGGLLGEAIRKADFSAASAPVRSADLSPDECYAVLRTLLANDVFFASLAKGRKHFIRLDYARVREGFANLAAFIGSTAQAETLTSVLAAPAIEKLPPVEPRDVIGNIEALGPVIARFDDLRRLLAG